jgi:non-ribosomal peptide synthetase component F
MEPHIDPSLTIDPDHELEQEIAWEQDHLHVSEPFDFIYDDMIPTEITTSDIYHQHAIDRLSAIKATYHMLLRHTYQQMITQSPHIETWIISYFQQQISTTNWILDVRQQHDVIALYGVIKTALGYIYQLWKQKQSKYIMFTLRACMCAINERLLYVMFIYSISMSIHVHIYLSMSLFLNVLCFFTRLICGCI